MSVINKMLRDLDSRQAAAARPAKAGELRAGIARDTLIVNSIDGLVRGPARIPKLLLQLTSVVAVVAAGLWWYVSQNAVPLPAASVKPVSAAAPKAAVVAAAAAVPASDAVLVTEPAVSAAPTAAPLPVKQPVTAPLADAGLKIDDTLSRIVQPEKEKEKLAKPLVRETTPVKQEKLPGRRVASLAASAAAAAPASPAVSSRQLAGQEVLAQAQNLWNAGSREVAIDLVREALAVAERANASSTAAANTPMLASLVRELARMEMAEGRVAQTLELLTRLEPALSGVADVWAIRGNAAQRLGRHPESAAAYLMALKLRPDEPRWMLGAAVSLAAQGQPLAAAELAEKARAGGVVSPEVAAYLRQLGVTLRER